MAYDLEEQEQIDEIKAFWDKHGNTILSAVTVVLFAFAGWRGWGWYQNNQSAKAAVVYQQLRSAVESHDTARVVAASSALFDDFPRTPYAGMGALMSARAQAEAGDFKAAVLPLRWLIEHVDDSAFQMTGRLQLASMLAASGAHDEALAALDTKVSDAYKGLFADRRGDILNLQGKTEAAREAYRAALGDLPESASIRRLVQLKIDTLGAGS